MTTEEKAKAYDEALERAKDCLTNKKFKDIDDTPESLTTYIFPELHESEDERMIRVIGLALTDVPEERFTSSETTLKDCLAYLEKQKDHFRDNTKMVELQDYSGLNDLERAIHRGFLSTGVENVPVTIIKETAQECLAQMKPAEWSEDDVLMLRRCVAALPEQGNEVMPTSYLNKLRDWLKSLPEKLNLQSKQEWSKEDKSFYDSIICEVIKEGMHPTPEQAKWFKSLPERFNFKPKKEWSEEDEKIYKMLNGMIHGTFTIVSQETVDELESWLKSLRSRPKSSDNWKPSEEQMEALNALLCVGDFSYVGQATKLQELYTELKKLI